MTSSPSVAATAAGPSPVWTVVQIAGSGFHGSTGNGGRATDAGLDYARREWRPRHFRLWVARWNERALRAYRRAGFRELPAVEESRFVEMERPA